MSDWMEGLQDDDDSEEDKEEIETPDFSNETIDEPEEEAEEQEEVEDSEDDETEFIGPGPGEALEMNRTAEEVFEIDEEEVEASESEETAAEESEAGQHYEEMFAEKEAQEAAETSESGSADELAPSTERFIKPGKFRYVPVMGFDLDYAAAAPFREDNDMTQTPKIDGREISWWEPDPKGLHPHYPYGLVNPVDCEKRHDLDVSYSEMCRFEEGEQLMMADSGGFQLASRDDVERVENPEDAKLSDGLIHPIAVTEWQIENANAGVIIDEPPFDFSGTKAMFGEGGKKIFNEWYENAFVPAKENTKRNAKEQVAYAQENAPDHFVQIGVIQAQSTPAGRDDSMFKLHREWHDAMLDVKEDWEAWSLSVKPTSSLGQAAVHLGYASQELQNARWIHVLGIGSIISKALFMYYSVLNPHQFVTSDSTSMMVGSRFREFYIPPGFGDSVHITEREDAEDVGGKFVSYPCDCAVCHRIKKEYDISFLTEGADSFRGSTICLHNLNMILQGQQLMHSLLEAAGEDVVDGLTIQGRKIQSADNKFWKMMVEHFSRNKVIQLYYAMKFLQTANNEGLDAVERAGWTIPWPENTTDSWTIKRSTNAMEW